MSKIKDKYDICYDEGKKFDFIPIKKIDDNGHIFYDSCVGNYPRPRILDMKCYRCRYLNKNVKEIVKNEII